MASLTSTLLNTSNAMDAMQDAMAVIQNNVVNASTPGYVTQTLTLNAQPFDPSENIFGGVQAGAVVSSRNQAAEENVWTQNTLLGAATQESTGLSSLQNIIGISSDTGIPAALNSLYSAFSSWSDTPSSSTAQQQVLSSAQGVAQAFNSAATQVEQLEQQTDGQLQSTVSQINQLTSQIATYNGQIREGGQQDAGLHAQLYNALETLSGLVNIQVQTESDGTVSVTMNGQIPLVLGTTQEQLSVQYPAPSSETYAGAPANAQLVTKTGTDVTSDATGGQLGGLLQFRNTSLPSVIGNPSQQGSLNQLAQAFADQVNQLLTSGQTESGAAGVPLFSYSSSALTSAAATLSVIPTVTGSQLAAADASSANGTANQLAAISSSTNTADAVNGQTYTDFYGSMASSIGTAASTAATAQSTQSDLLSQAQSLRSQVSGVSLDDQAATLMQFQQAYEASAQMISVINTTMQYLMTTFQSTQ